MNEQEAADYLGLPVEIVNSLAKRGYLKPVLTKTRPIKVDDQDGIYKKSSPNPFAFEPTHEYFFDEEVVKAFKEEQEQRKKEAERQEAEFGKTRYEIVAVLVTAIRTGRDGKEEIGRADLTFTGFQGSLQEAMNEGIEVASTDDDALPLTKGWRNHKAVGYEFSILVDDDDGSVQIVDEQDNG